jgi:hypothetical protein
MSTIAVNTITNAAGGNTAQINGMTPTADSLQGFRNRLINPGMVIDQRNAGAAVTINETANIYVMDRWRCRGESGDGVFTCQQDSTAPTGQGFKNSAKITVTTADASIAAGQIYGFQQLIEGFNVADLDWGTAAAKTVTLSFWVRSSLTGTFGGALSNGDFDRSYPFAYTISSANTWEQKTITIVGDTTGTWASTNGLGIRLNFNLGVGSTFIGTAGAWAAGNLLSATGAVSVVGTSGATFYITGVQLEAGSVATPFERRPYGTELALCQRYCFVYRNSGASQTTIGMATCSASTIFRFMISLPVTMRVIPTYANTSTIYFFDGAANALSTSVGGNASTVDLGWINLNVASGLTLGNSGVAYMEGASGAITFSSEL